MLRPLVMSIFGWEVVVSLRSASIDRTPKLASTRANVSPTGPPPTIRTWVVCIEVGSFLTKGDASERQLFAGMTKIRLHHIAAPTHVIIPTETIPRAVAATGIGLAAMFAELVSATVGPAVGITLSKTYGLPATMWAGACALVVVLIAALFMRETKQSAAVTFGRPTCREIEDEQAHGIKSHTGKVATRIYPVAYEGQSSRTSRRVLG